MSRKIAVAGKITGRPGVYQDEIRAEGSPPTSPLESGVLCLVGECEGIIQPKTVVTITNPRRIKEYLRKGNLYDAARFAMDAHRENPTLIRTPQKLIVVRANPATQGTKTLQSSAPADLIDLTSIAYGILANQVSVTVAAGTSAGPGKKLTISMFGESDEVGDDLGFLPAFIIRYTGDGTTAVMSISRTTLTTTLAGDQTDSSADLSCSFATYPTLDKLLTYINAQTGYEAIAVTNKPTTFRCEDLDFVTGADIKLVDSGSVTLGTSTTTSMTLAAVTAGSVVRLGAGLEYVYITTAGSPNTVIRGYLDSTAQTHSTVDADEFHAATCVNKAMIDWVNTNSGRITAARDTAYNVGAPNTLAQTYLTGGGEGSIGNSDWQDAFDALKRTKYNYIVPLSSSSTGHGYLKTHLNNKWGLWGQEAIGHFGAAKDETLAQLKTRAKALNSANMCMWFQDINRDDDTGTDTNYDPWALAVMAAAMQAGGAIGLPLTNKQLNISAIDQVSSIDLDDDDETLYDYGICHARFEDDEFRVVRALTTYTNDDYQHNIAPNVRTAVAWTVYKVRYRIKQRHLGQIAGPGDAASIKSTVVDTLDEIRDVDKAIVVGSQNVNGKRQEIPAYQDIDVAKSGNVTDVDYDFTPVDGNDFVRVSSGIVAYQDVA